MKKSPELHCRLIVSDFDGTLANSNNRVSEQNVAAIDKYVADGGIFAVCTGRILPSILPRVRDIGLKGLVIACQGSVIADIESGKIIRNVKLDSVQTAHICSELEKIGANVQAFTDEGFYTDIPAESEHLKLYESITGIKAMHTDIPVSSYILQNGISCQKVASLVAYEDQAELFNKLTGIFNGEFEVTCSAKVLIEITPVGENKGTALAFLSDYYGIDKSLTCAIGDNLNDLSMIEAAGYGIAVGNSSQALKERAKIITVTNDEHAVAKVINDYGYAAND